MSRWWYARRKGGVSASADGAIAAGRDVINPRTEIHYHVHEPAEPVGPGTGGVAPTVIFQARPAYPHLEFSIVNRGRTPVQITAIRVIKASSIKASHRGDGIEYLPGPRLQLDFDLRTAGSGSWNSSFSGRVANLAPLEAEAFVLDLSTVNTLNLVDIEFEYIDAETPHVLMARPSSIVYVDSPIPQQGYSGSVQLISRSAALASLFNGSPTPVRGPAVESCPGDVEKLFLRGVAHLCHDRVTEGWHDVLSRFGGSRKLGPAVASFAEFGESCGLPDPVRDGLEAWLGDPDEIRRASIWDNESHAGIVQKYLIAEFPSQLGSPDFTLTGSAAQCFRLLDSTLILDAGDEPALEDILEHTRFIMAETALHVTRESILQRLTECYGAGMIEYLLVNLRVSALAETRYEGLLEEILGSEAPPHGPTSHADRLQERWRVWWESQRGVPVYSKLAWRPLSPRLADAASALLARTPKDVPRVMDDFVMLAVARNPNVVDHFAPHLLKASGVQIRQELAMSRHTSSRTLEALARDPSSTVRRWVASNPSADDTTLDALREDEEEVVRSFIRQNPRLRAD